jgi:hypothetical protein
MTSRPIARAWILALACAAGCGHPVHRVGPIEPAAPRREPSVRALLFGDFGHRTTPQRLSAEAMRRAHEANPFDLAFQLGDNLYFCGPEPARPGAETCRFAEDGITVAPGATQPDDPIFRVNEEPLEGLRLPGGEPLPMFLALGNHDVGLGGGRCRRPGLSDEETMRRRACLSVARRTDAWTMPARRYVIDRGPLRVIVVDTNVVVKEYGGFTLEDELAFVREAVAPCGEGRLCVMAGHHPPAVVHGYGREPRAPSHHFRMTKLLDAAGGRVRAFFAGHVHALEHLTLGEMDVFISGSTAMGLGFRGFRTRWPAHAGVRFATARLGFAELEVHEDAAYRVRFVGTGGEPLHCCEAGREGLCRPVECG